MLYEALKLSLSVSNNLFEILVLSLDASIILNDNLKFSQV